MLCGYFGAGIPRQDFPIPGVICSDTLEPLNANFISEEFSLKVGTGKRDGGDGEENIFQSLFRGILSVRVPCKVLVNRNIPGKKPYYERAGGGGVK